jgi:hypothetical protein
MRLDKSATLGSRALWNDWWPPIVCVFIALAIWWFGDGQVLLWASSAAIGAPFTIFTLLAMFLLPGFALLRLCWPSPLTPIERWPLAIGLSCAILPLLFLMSEPIGLRWNTWIGWGFLVLCGVVVVWPKRGESWRSRWRDFIPTRPSQHHVLLLVLTIAALAVRLYVIRDLPVGLWGDSYHHTMIAQLLADNGGLFTSWRPYSQLNTFTYHYGFHSLVAWLNWLSGTPTTRGLMIIGQVESALIVPLLYVFTLRLLKRPNAALWAGLIVGFVSLFPAFYMNWGRYTQLGGQTILPVACVAWMLLLEQALDPATRRSHLVQIGIVVALATAGLAVTHYRVGVYLACFVASFCVALAIGTWRRPLALVRPALAGLGAGIFGILLTLPWLLRLREGKLLQLGSQFISKNIGTDHTNSIPALSVIITEYAKSYLLVLALLALVLLSVQRQWRIWVIVGWAALTWIAANPYLIGLTGAGILTSFAVLLAIYFVVPPMAGAGLDALIELFSRNAVASQWATRLQVLVGIVAVAWGIQWQQNMPASDYELFTKADLAAVEWIKAETPPDAKIFVNTFLAYGDSLYAGSDGGLWLPFLSGRESNLPPMTYGSEVGEDPLFYRRTNQMNAEVHQFPIGSAEAAQALREAGFQYVYDGPTANGVPAGEHEYIDPAELADSPWFELVYDHDGVTIWKVR